MRPLVLSAVLIALLSAPGGAAPQPAPPDGVAVLLAILEEALLKGDASAFLARVAPSANREEAEAFARETFQRGATRAVVRERDRQVLMGVLPGDGYQLLIETLVERGRRGRIATWHLDVRNIDGEWRILTQKRLTFVDRLHRLALDPKREYVVRDLRIDAEDLTLRIATGSMFVADAADEGLTTLVLMGQGEMVFSPAPAAEKGQLRLFCGAETLRAPFNVAFVRVSDFDLAPYLKKGTLTERRPGVRTLRRATAIFDEYIGKSFSVDLSDLSRDTWSLVPSPGDFLAEVRTRRFGVLTYTRSGTEAEDISLFDRRRKRNISVYASTARLATLGRFYDEDALVDYDVLDYKVDTTFDPEREWIDGVSTLKLRVAAFALATLNLRLAESLTVRSVTSDLYGRLLFLRVRGQNSLIVNLPVTVTHDSEFSLTVVYSGRVPSQSIEREAILLPPSRGEQAVQDAPTISPEPQFLYSNRSHWYPQSPVTDYATATLRVTVPHDFACVGTGEQPLGSPVLLNPKTPGSKKIYIFVAHEPLRYLACVVTRLFRVHASEVALDRTSRVLGGTSVETLPIGERLDAVALTIEANPRQQGRGRELLSRATDVLQFYTGLVGDYPYSSFTLAVAESELPGGHSPAYFAVLNQPLPTSQLVWRNDPVSFESYPQFFLAHELAHQWWGQAIGWKNYHEQWLSEGLSQYFAALYADHHRGRNVFDAVIRQMRRSAMAYSKDGPVFLGYRLGHIQGDSRVFRALVYNKAAMVLHMLRRFVGDEPFFAGLRRYYREWRFRKAGTDDLRKAFEAETERSLERFFERWIHEAGLPRVRFTHRLEPGPDGTQRVVARFEQIGREFDLPITVTLHFADASLVDVVVPVNAPTVEERILIAQQVRRVEVNRDEAALVEIVR
jgi:hypothetical protein